MMEVTEELKRKSASVLRIIKEQPGLSGGMIERSLGWTPREGRSVRTCIAYLRDIGEPITISETGMGYLCLDNVGDEHRRADLVKKHRLRTRSYLIDHARLMRQIGKMTAVEIAQYCLFDLLVPAETGEEIEDRPVSMSDIARLPVPRRAGLFALMMKFMDGMAQDPQAFAVERAAMAKVHGRMFLTEKDAENLRKAKELLASIAESN